MFLENVTHTIYENTRFNMDPPFRVNLQSPIIHFTVKHCPNICNVTIYSSWFYWPSPNGNLFKPNSTAHIMVKETIFFSRKYVGEFKDGMLNGQGTYSFPNGSKGVGDFREDNP